MLNPGSLLQNRYQIIQRIGGGGMGDVYLAYDSRLGNQQVIVKENRGGDPKLFSDEATILATLRHPNLPRVIDYFVETNQSQFLVMDYIAGQNLGQLVHARGALREQDALAWLNQILDAVKYLHANRIVHRDIKPPNIIITPHGNAVLVDFGIAKVLRPGQATASAAHGVGTAGYAPLEQYTGGTNERSDIYALGATLYYALTGVEPPPAPDRANGVALAPIRARNANVSPRTEQVVAKAMAVMIGQRYPTLDALQNDLRAYAPMPMQSPIPPQQSSATLMPRTVSAAQNAPAWIWILVGAGAMLVIGVFIGMLALLTQASATVTPTRVTGFVQATGTATIAATLTTTVTPTIIAPTLTPRVGTPSMTLLTPTSLPPDNALMMPVPAGEFKMGSDSGDSNAANDEKPQRTIYLDAFWIDKYEVTNALYRKCADAGKCGAPAKASSSSRTAYYNDPTYNNYPVIYVSWNDAKAYCEWAGKRLPTEAEWEKAARGTDGRVYPWGNTFDRNYLNSKDRGGRDTVVVGSYSSGASPYGVFDMSGNVLEWVADWYGENYYNSSARSNPLGPSTGTTRALRGGAWDFEQKYIRAAWRNNYVPAVSNYNIGFRCAKNP